MRHEGNTPKGNGYYGTIPRLDGSGQVSGELGIGVEFDGKHHYIPSMVPGLTHDEMYQLLSTDTMPRSVVDKAVAHARQRIAAGKSVWASPDEEGQTPMPVRR